MRSKQWHLSTQDANLANKKYDYIYFRGVNQLYLKRLKKSSNKFFVYKKCKIVPRMISKHLNNDHLINVNDYVPLTKEFIKKSVEKEVKHYLRFISYESKTKQMPELINFLEKTLEDKLFIVAKDYDPLFSVFLRYYIQSLIEKYINELWINEW
ncbi:hypothetical protein [Ureaplasma urealyticum]|uniref:Uncharacterized protein n=2 Tax=Ureaplasma urealyticum TaxID=2130 RepID=A0AAP9AD22_UREUR|nr:hypothetical protein [Ureaplasma urealyticum]ACI59745.1 conserved hypothetical protein [Ureaplasma urealyticum serovar 10 str. ATCC 33699]EDU06264.1 conserved hypothetical protein [Ureaplasma urealyticum serovar 5 str. ATCC 27817]EDX53279.1 conserved hypothetical protein [Ureaplasma urealyticum serovar 12 str. ATCC 33696]QDI63750.1 hypothetical protein EPH05_01980 [Ureaplasma urealyticum]QDI64954.1 hypothetical protein FJM05_01960 [Ureaplasma urealyticum]